MKAPTAASWMLAWACGACLAQDADPPPAALQAPSAVASPWTPRALFVQFGVADEVTASTLGAIWRLRRGPPVARWNVYAEASVSRWQARGGYPGETGVLTQLAAIPVLRYGFDEGLSPWFVEGGIGGTLTSSVYRSGDRHFSTAFNFGDHLGWGYAFGAARRDELALRIEHFSNAGIKHPNPGQNFVQLRFTQRFE